MTTSVAFDLRQHAWVLEEDAVETCLKCRARRGPNFESWPAPGSPASCEGWKSPGFRQALARLATAAKDLDPVGLRVVRAELFGLSRQGVFFTFRGSLKIEDLRKVWSTFWVPFEIQSDGEVFLDLCKELDEEAVA